MFTHFKRNNKFYSIILTFILALGIFLTPLREVAFANSEADKQEESVLKETENVIEPDKPSEDEDTKKELPEVPTDEEQEEGEGPTDEEQEEGEGPTEGDTDETENSTKIAIVHTNDTHARIKDNISFAKIPTIVQNLKDEGKEVLLLDAGDTLHGLPIATVSEGESIIEVMNAVGYDAMVPGNHDFNYGYDKLKDLKENANFNMIASNVVKKDGIKDFEEYIIREINGVKVGIFGLATPETKYKSHPDNTKGIEFTDPVETAKEMVTQLKNEGADIIIALSHLGMDDETAENERSTTVAQKVDGIDVIIDGHSHTTLPKGKVINGTLIAQTGEHNKNIGVVDITIKDEKIKKVAKLITSEEAESFEEDENVKAIIEKIEKEYEEKTSHVIGETKVRLDGEREKVRAGETNLANLITDIMLKAGEADVAITNGGGIRASIEAGKITMGDVIAVLPFGNYLVVKEVKGSDILDALEHGTSSYPELSGAFPQVAGMTYKLDLTKEVGDRVFDVKVNGEPLNRNKTYKVATNDFMAAGGDGYTSLKGGKLIVELPGLDEIVAEGIRDMKIVEGKLDRRMTVITEEDREAADEVIDIIDSLPEKITLDDKETVEKARKAYNALTEDQKSLVTNIAKLEKAEAIISELENMKPGEDPKTEPEKPTPEKPKGKGSLPKTGAAPWAATGLVGALMVAAGWKLKRKK